MNRVRQNYMISSQLTQEAREDFNIVLKMAESIGLADHRPSTTSAHSCLTNTRSTRRRSGHHSDLFHIERRERTNRVRERCNSQLATASHASHANSRKGSLNDVFHSAAKPYEDPVQYIQAQRLLIRNDLARLTKYSKNSERVQLISRDKQNRSKILGEVLEGAGAQVSTRSVFSQTKKAYSTPRKLYAKPAASKALTPRTASFEKLQLSLDCSKFNMVPRKDCMGKLREEPTRSRMVQTARDGCRPVRMQFNLNNKAELVYPISNSSQLLFPS